jgi:DNA-directed RNA polymerase subunit RPC12/RpoP
MSLDPPPINLPSDPVIETCVEADVKCYLCGALAGVIEADREREPRRVLFRRPGERVAAALRDVRHIRCPRCGGATFLDEVTVVTRRIETTNWLEDRPRRGRPPKRLLEQRRREREAREALAAAAAAGAASTAAA